MNSLFAKYIEEDKITEALLVGRNMVNKNPADYESVSAYLEFLLNLAEKLPNLDDKKSFLGQANITLSFFEENAELTEELIDKITEFRAKINDIANLIDEQENAKIKKNLKKIEEENKNLIIQIYSIQQKIDSSRSKEEFDRILQQIGEIDAKIAHDYLTIEQKQKYDNISKECTEIISSKIREFEYKSNLEYNKKAVQAFEYAFTEFKKDEGKYKNTNQLFSLVSKTLFAFDAAKLFNETLIYYNHVYSYIFSKLDENGKFDITKYSIECERKSR